MGQYFQLPAAKRSDSKIQFKSSATVVRPWQIALWAHLSNEEPCVQNNANSAVALFSEPLLFKSVRLDDLVIYGAELLPHMLTAV